MAQAPLRRCAQPGCGKLVRATRCDKHARERKQKVEQRRGTAAQRGYGSRWRRDSENYRKEHPLCVYCLFNGKLKAAECVDHIIPHRGNCRLFADRGNWCSACMACNRHKAWQERDLTFKGGGKATILCGLPATGKTTAADRIGNPVWDMDVVAAVNGWGEYPRPEPVVQKLKQLRREWTASQSGPYTLIVAHPIAAMSMAAGLGAMVRHVTCSEATRQERLAGRIAK